MASFKWTLCLLYFHLKALHTQTTSWTLTVPPVTKGLPGSCVVIPCLFDFPAQKNEMTEFTGMWKDAGENLICHSTDSEVMPMYRNRTRLVGNLAQKDCSLGIDPLNPSDVGPFHFRIEIAQLDSFSYVRNIVSIVMINEPDPISLSVKGEVSEGQTASVSCSVTHSCPTSPPVFTWSHLGREDLQSTPLDYGQLRTTSTLSFQPSREDHNKLLSCRIRHKGGRQQETTALLKVMYVPEIRNISHCTAGATLLTCICIVESNPPSRVQFLLSNAILDSTVVETNSTVTMGTLQVEQRPHQFIQCLANNTLGRANLTLSVTLLHSTGITNLYIIIATGGSGLLLTFLILTTVVSKWRRTRAPQTSQLEKDRAVALPQRGRKEDNVHGNQGGQFSEVYENVQTCMHDPIYANM